MSPHRVARAAGALLVAVPATACADDAAGGHGTGGSRESRVASAVVGDRAGDLAVAPRYAGTRWAALRAAHDAREVRLSLDDAAEVLTVVVRTRGRAVAAPRGTRGEARVSLYGEAVTNLLARPARGRVLVEPEDPELGPTTSCAGATAAARGRRVVVEVPYACLGEETAWRTRTWLVVSTRAGAAKLSDTTRLSSRLSRAAP